jgi:hypothetical protein
MKAKETWCEHEKGSKKIRVDTIEKHQWEKTKVNENKI